MRNFRSTFRRVSIGRIQLRSRVSDGMTLTFGAKTLDETVEVFWSAFDCRPLNRS